MKKTFAIIALLALVFAFALPAHAQKYGCVTLANPGGSTQYVFQGCTSNLNITIPCQKQDTVAVMIKFNLDGTGTDAQTLTFERSLDGTNWETLAAKKTVVGIAATGATVSTTITNIPTYGAGYIRLASWANAVAAQNTTNIVLKYAVKIQAP